MIESDESICQMVTDNVPLSYITKALKKKLDTSFGAFHEDWIGTLNFQVKQYVINNILTEDVPLEQKNIMEFVHFETKDNTNIPNYYFCKEKYSTSGGYDGPGYEMLVKDIQLASISSGYRINRNGNRPLKNSLVGARRLSCKRCQSYRGKTDSRQSEEYRTMSFNNNKQHSRRLKDPTNPSRNQKLTRRRDTSLSMTNNELCPFKILISYDDLGFFVINGRGNNIHKNHAKNIPA